jgi:hypothetical protein
MAYKVNIPKDKSEMIVADRNYYLKLKRRYAEAVKNNEESFILDGKEYLTSYAKYLLQYLEYRGMK